MFSPPFRWYVKSFVYYLYICLLKYRHNRAIRSHFFAILLFLSLLFSLKCTTRLTFLHKGISPFDYRFGGNCRVAFCYSIMLYTLQWSYYCQVFWFKDHSECQRAVENSDEWKYFCDV